MQAEFIVSIEFRFSFKISGSFCTHIPSVWEKIRFWELWRTSLSLRFRHCEEYGSETTLWRSNPSVLFLSRLPRRSLYCYFLCLMCFCFL